MRIGEIAIVGPERLTIDAFIRSVCNEVEIQNETLTFGKFAINKQLMLHLYGMVYTDDSLKPGWDLMSAKLMGYVFVFDWTSAAAVSELRPAIDALTTRYKVPFIAAAAVNNKPAIIQQELVDSDIHLSGQTRFTFYNPGDQDSVKNVLLILVNTLLDKVAP